MAIKNSVIAVDKEKRVHLKKRKAMNSQSKTSVNKATAVLFLRLILGLIFLMQGIGKVFMFGKDNVFSMLQAETKGWFPEIIVHVTGFYTSYVELIAGLLLVIGLKVDYALYTLASVLVIVCFGHGLVYTIWDLSHVIPRVILLTAILLLPKEWDRFSIDHWMKKRANLN